DRELPAPSENRPTRARAHARAAHRSRVACTLRESSAACSSERPRLDKLARRMATEPANADAPADEELAETAWDLDPIVEGQGAEGVERRLGEALERSQAF